VRHAASLGNSPSAVAIKSKRSGLNQRFLNSDEWPT
jgi:hypothetical protein